MQKSSRKKFFKDDIENDFPEWEKKKLGRLLIKNHQTSPQNKIEDNFWRLHNIWRRQGFLKSRFLQRRR